MIIDKNNKEFKIDYDGKITLAEGRSRKEINWRNKELNWSELVLRLSKTERTLETHEEFNKFPKDKRDNIKDVGGFVGGTLKGGRRKAYAVINRSLITLDADYVKDGIKGNIDKCGESLLKDVNSYAEVLWNLIKDKYNFSCLMYSTHSHKPENPRVRLVIPLSRPVLPGEYEAISRKIAEDLGINIFDDTTYQTHRLMYWPSTSKDGEYLFRVQDKPWLEPDDVLDRYQDWSDDFFWPESSKNKIERDREVQEQGDPLKKQGIVGAFCRTYSIPEAIETFLRDIYKPCVDPNRYTYVEGSTSGGLILYNDVFAYSHHNTDPISKKLCNAFDLVRIHKYGHLDEGMDINTKLNKLPSYGAMLELAREDKKVKLTLGEERMEEARATFGNLELWVEDDEAVEADNSWLAELDMDKRGKCIASIKNVTLILENDPRLKGKIGYNELSHRVVIRGILPWLTEDFKENEPWKDSDDSCLRWYMEVAYEITGAAKITDALNIVIQNNKFSPVKEYLSSLSWDGIKRVETAFIDYLGAEDTAYNKLVTRKWFTGAVARTFVPGIKFDYMPVLAGKQGIGKTYMLSKLGKEWYSDNLFTMQGKEAMEQTTSVWILEVGEMNAYRKADVEAVKQFISKTEDNFRVAYGKHTSIFPRQCVFAGTTNDKEFLRDITGNRRFWPIDVGVTKPKKDLWNNFSKEVDQLWAEAVEIWNGGEELYLRKEEEALAFEQQESHTEFNAKFGVIQEYLDKLLPSNWKELDINERRMFIHGSEFGDATEGNKQRERICVMEIWGELFQGDIKQLTPVQSREINDIMRRMPGWERYPNSSGLLKFGKIYGTQRAYIRKISG